jgi:hypothetical protein
MRFHSILVLSGALAAAPALIFATGTPPDFPHDLTVPFPRDIGANGSQHQRYYNGGLSPAVMGPNAGSFGAMCGLDARLDLSLNFTGARPANNGCDCDFRAQAREINGYPTELLAAASTTLAQATTTPADDGSNCAVELPCHTPAKPSRQMTRARPHPKTHRPVHAARMETRRRPAKNTGSASREAPSPPPPAFRPTPVQWVFLGALAVIILGAISALFRRHRVRHV